MTVGAAIKLASLATDKKTWKVVVGVLLSLVLVIALLGSGFQAINSDSGTATAKEFSVLVKDVNDKIQDGEPKINTKLLYGIYMNYFRENPDYTDKNDVKSRLIACFYIDMHGRNSAIQDTNTIFDNVQKEFKISINENDRKNVLEWSETLPDSYSNGQMLTSNLVQSLHPEQDAHLKTNIGLVNFAWNALDCQSGYVYGGYGQTITLDYLIQQQNLFVGDEEANLTDDEVMYINEHYGGHPAFDCIGLIKAYGWINEETGEITSGTNGMPEVGANSIMKVDGLVWGDISTMPDVPGLAVQMDGHIGVYIGDGEVIEAEGNHYGVAKTKLEGRGWKRWLEVPSLTYVDNGLYNIHGTFYEIADRQIKGEATQ